VSKPEVCGNLVLTNPNFFPISPILTIEILDLFDLEQVCWQILLEKEHLVKNWLNNFSAVYSSLLNKIRRRSAEKILPFFKHASSSAASKISMDATRRRQGLWPKTFRVS
jgi:hypothetical protein